MAPESDRALVAALRRGDRAAFERVYARHKARIYGFLVRMVGRPDTAEDLFQETWIKLAVHAARLADDTDLAGWLYTVARNLALSHLRVPAEPPSADGCEPPGAAPSPVDWLSASETQAHLERALGELPPHLREVILLVAVEGLRQDQVAAVLGASHDAVRQRLTRARTRLAERLEELARPARASIIKEKSHAAR